MMNPHETPAERRRATSALDTRGLEAAAHGLQVAPMADAPQRLPEERVKEFRRRLGSGMYAAPEVLDTVAMRLLESGALES